MLTEDWPRDCCVSNADKDRLLTESTEPVDYEKGTGIGPAFDTLCLVLAAFGALSDRTVPRPCRN